MKTYNTIVDNLFSAIDNAKDQILNLNVERPNLFWEDYFMLIAEVASLRSKDKSSRVGAVIVNQNNEIVATGYNGWIAGCDETRMSDERPLKYHLTIHAEMNAVAFAKQDLTNCKLYITHGPCDNCLKHILGLKIREIYYRDAGIMRERGSDIEKEAIKRLLNSVDSDVPLWKGIEGGPIKQVVCKNWKTRKSYITELFKNT